jgi:hypothetical protein
MDLNTNITRKMGQIDDHLSTSENGRDNTHNDVVESNDECPKGASVTRIEVINAVSSPRSRYVLYAGYAI